MKSYSDELTVFGTYVVAGLPDSVIATVNPPAPGEPLVGEPMLRERVLSVRNEGREKGVVRGPAGWKVA